MFVRVAEILPIARNGGWLLAEIAPSSALSG
jgi:hypothetical protein